MSDIHHPFQKVQIEIPLDHMTILHCFAPLILFIWILKPIFEMKKCEIASFFLMNEIEKKKKEKIKFMSKIIL